MSYGYGGGGGLAGLRAASRIVEPNTTGPVLDLGRYVKRPVAAASKVSGAASISVAGTGIVSLTAGLAAGASVNAVVTATGADGAIVTMPLVVTGAGAAAFLPTSRNGGIIADSRGAQGRGKNGGSTSVVEQRFGRGPQHFISLRSYGRVQFPAALNFGRSGASLVELLDTIDADIAAGLAGGVGFWLYLAGRNGIAAGDTLAATLAAEATIIAKLKATGLPIIVIGDWPSAAPTYPYLQAPWDVHRALADARDAYAGDAQITYVDGFALFNNRASAVPFVPSGVQSTYYAQDDLHLHVAPIGANVIAEQPAIQNKLAEWFPIPSMPVAGQLDAYGREVLEVIDINGDFAGTGGNIFGTSGGVTSTGQLPDGWIGTSTSSPGVVRTNSFTTMDVGDDVGLRAVRIALSGTVDNTALRFVRMLERGPITVAAGSKIYLQADMAVAAGASNVQSLEGALVNTGTETTAHPRWFTSAERVPPTAYSGRILTEVLTVPAGQSSTTVRFNAPVTTSGVVAAQSDWARARLVRVA